MKLRLLLTLLVVPCVAIASQPRVSMSPSGPFRPGDIVTVRWEGMPSEVEEMEFLLARGDRVHEIVRLTPQLHPHTGSFPWRVPALPSEHAVLRLRAGINDKEVDLAESAAFAIDGVVANEPLDFREGEWWESVPASPWSHHPQASGVHLEPAGREMPAGFSRQPLLISALRPLPRFTIVSTATRSPERILLNLTPRSFPQRK